MSVQLSNPEIHPLCRVLYREDLNSTGLEMDLLWLLRFHRHNDALRERVAALREENPDHDDEQLEREGLLAELPSVELPHYLPDQYGVRGENPTFQKLLPVEIPLSDREEAQKCRERVVKELGDHCMYVGTSPSRKTVWAVLATCLRDLEGHASAVLERILPLGYLPRVHFRKRPVRIYLTGDLDAHFAGSPEEVEPYRELSEFTDLLGRLPGLVREYSGEVSG